MTEIKVERCENPESERCGNRQSKYDGRLHRVSPGEGRNEFCRGDGDVRLMQGHITVFLCAPHFKQKAVELRLLFPDKNEEITQIIDDVKEETYWQSKD